MLLLLILIFGFGIVYFTQRIMPQLASGDPDTLSFSYYLLTALNCYKLIYTLFNDKEVLLTICYLVKSTSTGKQI